MTDIDQQQAPGVVVRVSRLVELRGRSWTGNVPTLADPNICLAARQPFE